MTITARKNVEVTITANLGAWGVPTSQDWLQRIHDLKIQHPVKIINVCGGHERTIAMAGLRTALPANIAIIPGPGCPVCVCPEADLRAAIQIANIADVTLVAFGDLLRVPIRKKVGTMRCLEDARVNGADIRPIASPQEAVKVAKSLPKRRVVFFGAGFETTMAPIAALLAAGVPDNLWFLLSGRRTWPAVAMLLARGRGVSPHLTDATAGFDALIAPGHVATIMGAAEWNFVVERYGIPTAVAGFTPLSMLTAIYSVLRQLHEQRYFVDNCYPESVHVGGNPTAQRYLQQVFDTVDANWRGIGTIPASGLVLNSNFQKYDVCKWEDWQGGHSSPSSQQDDAITDMPAGCKCTQVLLGRCYPTECRLFATACHPTHPIGPCMVSAEGACHIWWSSGGLINMGDVGSPLRSLYGQDL